MGLEVWGHSLDGAHRGISQQPICSLYKQGQSEGTFGVWNGDGALVDESYDTIWRVTLGNCNSCN